MLAARARPAAVGGPVMGMGRTSTSRAAVATAIVLSVVAGPLPLVPLGGPGHRAVGALVCGTDLDAATGAPDVATSTAAVRAAVAAAAGADPACAAWTVTLRGTFPLEDDVVHAAAVPLVLAGADGVRAELHADGTARILTLLRPATTVTLRDLVLRGGDADGTDLDGVGGAVGAEVASSADPTPSRVTAEDVLLVANTAARGGAVSADEVVLVDVDLVANTAPLGGAVDAGALTATRTQFVANTAPTPSGQGGAVRASGDVTLTTATFTANAAATGGSVWLSGAAEPVLRAVATTFADARADVGGHVAGDASLGGSVRVVLRGTVLTGVAPLTPDGPTPAVCAGTVAHAGPAPDVAVAAVASDASCPVATVPATAPALTALPGTDGAVEGRTRLLVPAADGPLVDVADCTDVWPATDARGLARPQPDGGRCDVGAVEVPAVAPDPDPYPDPDPDPDPDLDPDPPRDAGPDATTPVPAAVRAGAAPVPRPTWHELLGRWRRQ